MSTSAPALPTQENPIIFYDLLCSTPQTCWSPHCWKTRIVLQLKGIPFRTVWVSFADIKTVVGHTQPDDPAPTLPVIQHGTTWVFDSWSIINYLEQLYPSPPLLHPSPQSIHFFQTYLESQVWSSLFRWIVPRVPAFLDERGREWFFPSREAWFGAPLEEVGKGQTIYQIKGPLGPVAKNLGMFGPYLGGETLNYADIVLLGTFLWIQKAEPEALETILDMYRSPSKESETEGKAILGEWFGLVKHLAVTLPDSVPTEGGQ